MPLLCQEICAIFCQWPLIVIPRHVTPHLLPPTLEVMRVCSRSLTMSQWHRRATSRTVLSGRRAAIFTYFAILLDSSAYLQSSTNKLLRLNSLSPRFRQKVKSISNILKSLYQMSIQCVFLWKLGSPSNDSKMPGSKVAIQTKATKTVLIKWRTDTKKQSRIALHNFKMRNLLWNYRDQISVTKARGKV